MTHFRKRITINAPKTQVWNALADLGGVYRFHPGVSNSYYTSDKKEGLGASRVCELYPAGKVEETATHWVESESFILRVDPIEKAPPVKDFTAGVKLSDVIDGIEVSIDINYDMKLGVVGTILNSIVVKSQMEKAIQGLLDGLKIHLEQGHEIKNMKTLNQLIHAA